MVRTRQGSVRRQHRVGCRDSARRAQGMRYNGVMSRKAMVLAHRDRIREIAAACNAESVALFGSTARGEDTETSDCDFIADFKPRTTLFHVGEMQYQLEELLGCSVDITSRRVVPAEAAHVVEESILL